jgi:hypothetical protein
MEIKVTYDSVFLTWLPDVSACHEKKNIKNLQNEKKILLKMVA